MRLDNPTYRAAVDFISEDPKAIYVVQFAEGTWQRSSDYFIEGLLRLDGYGMLGFLSEDDVIERLDRW